jgi:hypothetical protein
MIEVKTIEEKHKGLYRHYKHQGKKVIYSLWSKNGVFSEKRLLPVKSFLDENLLLRDQ